MISSEPYTFVNFSECQLRDCEEEKDAVDDFADVLVREATAIDSKVEAQSVSSAIHKCGLSWQIMENQRKKVVVERLREIGNLNESQCNDLFDKMDEMVPIDRDTQRRNCIVERKWIMKRMCTLSACFLCRFTSFCGLLVIEKVSPDDVGEEAILNSIKIEIGTSQFPMSQMCYCKSPLHRLPFKRPFSDWRCSSCFAIQSGRISFDCVAGDCLFKRISSTVYRVCPSCFGCLRESDSVDSCHETDQKEDGAGGSFVARQINRVISMISSDSLYLHT